MTRVSLVGRDATIEAALRVFDEGHRWVGLFGPPGVGKSRVLEAIAVATGDRFDAAIVVRPGSPTRDELTDALAFQLGIALAGGDQWGRLVEVLKRRGRLFVGIDDLDDPSPLEPDLRVLVEATTDLVCVVASGRTPALPGIVPIELRPLSLDSDRDRPSDAAVLFRRLALAAAPEQTSGDTRARIESIAGELEGMPAAIELAAAMLRTMTLDELHESLQASRVRAGVLHASVERIAESVAHAWSLLADEERHALASLTACETGFSIALAAETIGIGRERAASLLELFRSRSLVVTRIARGRMRFDMLRDVRRSVRRHAGAATLEAAAARHLAALAKRLPDLGRAWIIAGDASALAQIREDESSIEAVIRDPRASPEERLACGVALAAARVEASPHAALAILDHVERGATPSSIGRLVRALATFQIGRAEALAATLASLRAIGDDPEIEIVRLIFESALERGRGREELAMARAEQARERALDVGHRALEAWADLALSHAALRAGEVDRAHHLARGAAYVVEETRHARLRTEMHLLLAVCELHASRPHDAAAHLRDAIASAVEVGDVRSEVASHVLLAWAAAFDGTSFAERLVLRAEHRAREAGLESDRLLAIARALLSDRPGPLLEALVEASALAGDAPVHRLASAVLSRVEPARAPSDLGAGVLLEPVGGEDLERATRLALGHREPAVGPHARWVARWVEGRPLSDAPRPAASSNSLLVRRDGRAFRRPPGEWIPLPKGSPVCNVLVCLAESGARMPGRRVPLEVLIERGWPGERILQRAARSRAYMAISKLRNDGLRELLLRDEDGYFLDPSVEVALVD